ncbi:PREDICTED: uncharacterized protein LOC109243951 [Nicotiana attenuata]|uniref:Uncharacterized protein n=1 Tax=Nicotiana attenuata TaxID=49451 RepID=A0A314L0C6_NICAT|nr:PREDICTED: uncharacterized protein LOC109243951 [Nicotiana attenuata]OIT34993.1 hypothetical protein A4A49_16048 [Nicotiana attenuata]
MASACISTCVNDIARAPVRATYINLYKWPESDAEFIKSVSKRMNHVNTTDGSINHQPKPKVVDSISCRQLYLRSYTFSREENVNEKTVLNCYGRVKDGVRRKKKARNIAGSNSSGGRRSSRRKRKGFRKAKEISCAALASIFRRLLSCTTKVDVVG